MSEHHSFSTREEATAAGYTKGQRIRHRGFFIYSRDVSGPHSFGYNFAVAISREFVDLNDDEPTADLQDRIFGCTVTVWLSEGKNAIGGKGSFIVRYAPGVWKSGVEAAKAAIDGYYAASPRAAARQATVDADWAAIRERQDAKAAGRAATRGAMRARRDAASC